MHEWVELAGACFDLEAWWWRLIAAEAFFVDEGVGVGVARVSRETRQILPIAFRERSQITQIVWS